MADDLQRIELLVLKDTPSRNKPGAGKRLSVVQWAKNGKQVALQLIQADYWINENDKGIRFKSKGASLDDIRSLFVKPEGAPASVWNEKVEPIRKNPPAVVAAAPKAAASSDETIEEVPF